MFKTTVSYLARSAIFETERAFDTDFPVDHVPGARKTNHENDPKIVTIHDVSPAPDVWDLNIHGFCILKADTHLSSADAFERKKKVQESYWHEIEALLHEKFPEYSRIESYDCTVRRRDPEFPRSSRTYDPRYEQPATRPHSDGTRRGAFMQLEHSFPGQEASWKDKDFDILNVWRPLRGPNNDWPLAMCDWTTIDQEDDIRLNDGLRRDRIDENSLLHFNESHRWYYIKNQSTRDLLVFRAVDSLEKRARGFHCAVMNPDSKDQYRESVEVRVVAFR